MGSVNRLAGVVESQLPVLVGDGVISQEDAEKIRNYYRKQKAGETGIGFLLISVVAALFLGLGIILLLAYNWSHITPGVKIGLIISVLLASQGLAWYAVVVRKSSSWLEPGAILLSLVVGASIALISQIYQIPGNFAVFLLVWLFLVLPLIYLMNSLAVSLLVILGIVYWAIDLSFSWPSWVVVLYSFGMLGAVLPRLVFLRCNNALSVQTAITSWVYAAGFFLVLYNVTECQIQGLLLFFYSVFLLFFTLAGEIYSAGLGKPSVKRQEGNVPELAAGGHLPIVHNPFSIIGRVGILILSFALTSEFMWPLVDSGLGWHNVLVVDSFIITAFVAGMLWIIVFHLDRLRLNEIYPYLIIPPMILVYLILSRFSGILFFNLYTLFLGVWTIRNGVLGGNTGQMNRGMLIILSLIALRFFDLEMSLLLRGVLFILLGLIFLACSWFFSRRRKEQL